MRAMLLAAGRGERMRPLTLERPKPLLEVAGKALIDWHIERLVAAGIADLVINVSWLGDQLVAHCGAGGRYGASIRYSREEEPLETAGGILRALPYLGSGPFLVINADIWTDYPVGDLAERPVPAAGARLVLVDNPGHNEGGDFSLRVDTVIERDGPTLTFAGIGLYDPAFFAGTPAGKQPLLPLFRRAIRDARLAGEHYPGAWTDVGTPERLRALDARLRSTAYPPPPNPAEEDND